MKFVIQRVKHAEVTVDGNTIGMISKGYMVLIGVSNCDDEVIADRMLDKMIKLRIFEDENGKTNLSLADVGGELLLISQFTLYLVVIYLDLSCLWPYQLVYSYLYYIIYIHRIYGIYDMDTPAGKATDMINLDRLPLNIG